MGDDGVAGPPAKKRGATRQISKEDGSDSEGESFVPESGSFQKASEEVIASRRIVKVRRTAAVPATATTTTTAAPNPFASIRLVAPTVSSGLAPVSLVPSVPLAPPVEPLEAGGGKDATTSEECMKNANHADEVQDGRDDKQETFTELDGESVEVAEATTTQGTAVVVDTHRSENGEGEDEMPTEGGEHQSVSVSKEGVSSEGVDVKADLSTGSDANEPACVTITDVGLVVRDTDEGQPDNNGKQGADVKEPGLSQQVDEAKVEDSAALPSTNSLDKGVVKDPLPSLGTATPGSFTFGTAPALFETPTAFASFSSTWSAFGSGTASGTSLGSGFAFSKGASEGAFASAATAFSNSNGSSFQLFSSQSSSTTLSAGPPLQPPTTALQFQGGNTQTGEEQEKMAFGADATLFEFVDASWKERGKGELRVNVPIDKSGKARLLMRSKGNFRLILNASLFPDIKMTSMDSRGVTFACVNSAVEEKSGLVTYAVKFKDSIAAGNFRDAVDAHKCPPEGGLKTPENSPSALHGL
eukprot:c9949_g1_i1 orf=158-1741(+)